MHKKISIALLLSVMLPSLAFASIVEANVTKGLTSAGLCFGSTVYGANVEYGILDYLSAGVDYASMDLTFVPPVVITKPLGNHGEWYASAYDLHLNWQINRDSYEQRLNISLIAGIGGVAVRDGSTPVDNYMTFVGGVCLSAPVFVNELTLRVNLVSGLPFGAELAWKMSEKLEVSLGVTAMGIFGVKASF